MIEATLGEVQSRAQAASSSGVRLLTYRQGGEAIAGLLIGSFVHPAEPLLAPEGIDGRSLLSILEQWERAETVIGQVALRVDPASGSSLANLELLSPVLYPNAIYCAAANYRDHMRAMARKLQQPDEPDPHELDIKPYHFVVPGRSCLAGPGDPIRMPVHGSLIDWEIELVAVIGCAAKDVPVERALEHVAAYTIGNDVSVRDRRFIKIPNVSPESVFRNDFIGMKGFDQSCAIGPWLVPAREIADPQRLALKLWIDGELMQSSSTSEMVFSVAEQIAYLSSRVTLLPGDLVMTGTPAGTGMERDRFLRRGETLRLQIEGIGEMSQRVV